MSWWGWMLMGAALMASFIFAYKVNRHLQEREDYERQVEESETPAPHEEPPE